MPAHWSDSLVQPLREQHYALRHVLIRALRDFQFSEEAKPYVHEYDDYLEFWQSHYGDRWLDMATFVRLGTVVECCLREAWIRATGVRRRDAPRRAFQRLGDGP